MPLTDGCWSSMCQTNPTWNHNGDQWTLHNVLLYKYEVGGALQHLIFVLVELENTSQHRNNQGTEHRGSID